METYRQMHSDENNTCPQRDLQFAQYFVTGPMESGFDSYRPLEIDGSMSAGKTKTKQKKLDSLLASSGKLSIITDTLLYLDNPSKMESIDEEIRDMVENRAQDDEEFENVSLATGNLGSDLPSVDQMNSNNVRHIGENFVAHSQLALSAQRRRRIAMALVIFAVVVAIVVIIVIGINIFFCSVSASFLVCRESIANIFHVSISHFAVLLTFNLHS